MIVASGWIVVHKSFTAGTTCPIKTVPSRSMPVRSTSSEKASRTREMMPGRAAKPASTLSARPSIMGAARSITGVNSLANPFTIEFLIVDHAPENV